MVPTRKSKSFSFKIKIEIKSLKRNDRPSIFTEAKQKFGHREENAEWKTEKRILHVKTLT